MTSCLMDTSHDYLISTAHVSAEYAPYYVGWVRQAHKIAGDKLTIPLSRDGEQKTLQELRRVYRYRLRLTYPPGVVGFTGAFVGSVCYSHSMVAGGLLKALTSDLYSWCLSDC